MSNLSKWCLIGVPDHQGVANVGGRIGAARGPAAFRKAFARLKGQDGVLETMSDLGNVGDLTADVAANHRQAADAVARAQAQFGVSVVVGGGHDHGFSHLKGISVALTESSPELKLGCINIDAHLDLRKPDPQITSGSPFYLAIESGVLKPSRLIEFGIQSQCNGPALWEYARKMKISIEPFSKLRNGSGPDQFAKALSELKKCDAIVVSLDLDAIAQAFAPGVSAPQSEGFLPNEIMAMMETAGEHPKVVSLGIFELNPEHDIDERTAKLAASAAYHFVEASLRR